jgi:hypothetical protein
LKLVVISDLTEILLWSEPMDLILLKLLEARRKVNFGMILEFLIVTFIALGSVLGEIVIFGFVVTRPLWDVRIRLIGI